MLNLFNILYDYCYFKIFESLETSHFSAIIQAVTTKFVRMVLRPTVKSVNT